VEAGKLARCREKASPGLAGPAASNLTVSRPVSAMALLSESDKGFFAAFFGPFFMQVVSRAS
jgi:hypothetical protein